MCFFCLRSAHFFVHFYKRVFLCRLPSSIDTSEGETYQVQGQQKKQLMLFLFLSRHILSSIISCLSQSLLWTKKWNMYKLGCCISIFFYAHFWFVGCVAKNTGNASFFVFFLLLPKERSQDIIIHIMSWCVQLWFATKLYLKCINYKIRPKLNQKSDFLNAFLLVSAVLPHWHAEPVVCPSLRAPINFILP